MAREVIKNGVPILPPNEDAEAASVPKVDLEVVHRLRDEASDGAGSEVGSWPSVLPEVRSEDVVTGLLQRLGPGDVCGGTRLAHLFLKTARAWARENPQTPLCVYRAAVLQDEGESLLKPLYAETGSVEAVGSACDLCFFWISAASEHRVFPELHVWIAVSRVLRDLLHEPDEPAIH